MTLFICLCLLLILFVCFTVMIPFLPILCDTRTRVTPSNTHPNINNHILCPYCCDITAGEYCNSYYEISICFTCFIPVWCSRQYLACVRCGYPFGTTLTECRQCHTTRTNNSKYCPMCGTLRT